MAYKNDRPIVALYCILDRLDRFHIQVVRRLVEDQQVGSGQHHHRKRNTGPLPTRERRRSPRGLIARKAESTQMSVNQPAFPLRAHITYHLSLIHISEPTRQAEISYAVFCLKKKKENANTKRE